MVKLVSADPGFFGELLHWQPALTDLTATQKRHFARCGGKTTGGVVYWGSQEREGRGQTAGWRWNTGWTREGRRQKTTLARRVAMQEAEYHSVTVPTQLACSIYCTVMAPRRTLKDPESTKRPCQITASVAPWAGLGVACLPTNPRAEREVWGNRPLPRLCFSAMFGHAVG